MAADPDPGPAGGHHRTGAAENPQRDAASGTAAQTRGGRGLSTDPAALPILRERAPAKLNLYLHVTGRRPDGFHLLDSLAIFLDLGEEVRAQAAAELTLRLEGPFAAELSDLLSADNLVLRAAEALRAHLRRGPRGKPAMAGAELTLTKTIPVAAGLGGGSADAAATLRLLARLWHPGQGEALAADLTALAAGLGADLPVCLQSRPSLMAGIGEQLAPAPALPDLHLVLVNPRVPLSTARVFAGLQGRFGPPMPLGGPLAGAHDLAAALARRRNDLEPVARFLAPAVDRALAALAGQENCLLARMSGSGATCFGLFPHPPAATRAAAALRRAEPDWWVAQASTRSRDAVPGD